jgi:hypothetical protein
MGRNGLNRPPIILQISGHIQRLYITINYTFDDIAVSGVATAITARPRITVSSSQNVARPISVAPHSTRRHNIRSGRQVARLSNPWPQASPAAVRFVRPELIVIFQHVNAWHNNSKTG